MSKLFLAIFAFALANSVSAAEPAAVATPPMTEAITVSLEDVFDKPVAGGPVTTRPVVAAPGISLPAELTAFGNKLVIKTRDEARAEQLAWFFYVSKLEATADKVVLGYWTPYNGKYGTVTLGLKDGHWAIEDHEHMHSSSGARNFYGELYEGVECRDGGEMAKRWNAFNDAVAAMQAGRERTPFEQIPSTCPAKEFPDVASYKQQKAMGLIK